LPILNNTSGGGTNKASTALKWTFAVIPLLTYIISAAAVGYLTSKRIKEFITNWYRKLKDWLKDLTRSLQQALSCLGKKPGDPNATAAQGAPGLPEA
jgi:hypothetical protein